MKRLQSFLTLLVLLLVSTVASYAVTREVGSGKPYTTIQAAVTAANGGDIIEVYSGTYTENVNIPGGKNGLIIREKSGETAILNGATAGNPKVAFRVASDNVTISGFTIQNYNYTGATNVGYGQPQRGIGIEAINASSQHTFTKNTIFNCNWGIYVREGNNINVDDNNIRQFFATSFGSDWFDQGGVGIAFISDGIAMDGNIINDNLLEENTSPDYNYGIIYGRLSGGYVGADFVRITNNVVDEFDDHVEFYAYGIFNIKTGESIDFSNNTSSDNDAALDIVSSSASDNDDVTITNNKFFQTDSDIEVRTSEFYSGEKLWELMVTNGNDFSGTDLSNAIASLEYLTNSITSDGIHRFILNNLDAAITEAEEYMNVGADNDGRVYVTNGTYSTSSTATVNGLPVTKKLLIKGESLAAIIKSSASTILDIQSNDVEVDPLTFTADLNATPITSINTTGDNTKIHHVAFTSNTGGPGSYYIGVKVNDAADNVDINNNTFDGMFQYGIQIESVNTVKANIECNQFNQTVSLINAVGIYVNDFNAGGNITNIEIYNNTFEGFLGFSIDINLPTVASDNIVIGKLNKGNIFNHNFTAVRLTQMAVDQVEIKYNKFAGTFATYINNTAAFNVNAGFNYFNEVAPYPTNITAKLTGAGVASPYPPYDIAWLPIYTNGTDQDIPTCGFQPLLTSLWTPVYTAEVLNDPITDTDNKFYLTIWEALDDAETKSGAVGDNPFVYLYLSVPYAEINGNAVLPFPDIMNFNSAGITVAAAPAQPANMDTRPSPEVSSNFAGPIFDVNFNNITFDNIKFNSAANIAYYPINVAATVTDGVTVTNCKFDVSGATNPDAAIFFTNSSNIINVKINSNKFNIGNGNYAVDFGTAAAFSYKNVEVDNNTFDCPDNTTTAIRFNNVDNLDVTDNMFEAGIAFVGNAGSVVADSINIYGNLFLPTAASVPVAISFTPGAANLMKYVKIKQNQIQQFGIGIDITAVATANVFDFQFWSINENYFANMNDGIDLNGLVVGGLGYLDATNNHWESNYGPLAEADAPNWHEAFAVPGTNIIANSFGYLYNTNFALTVVPLQEATYIQFVPWWNDNSGSITAANPGYFVGTSFAPIENNEATIEYFASLIFAIDETSTGFEIYMKDVPDSQTPGQTSYYVEENTIENESKNLDIWGAPFYPPTTKIATSNNGAADDMFNITTGTFNLNFLEFVYDPNASSDFGSAVEYGSNGAGTIDWCSFNGIQGTTVDLYVVFASDASTDLTITNSRFLNNTHSVDVENAVADNAASLVIDNTTFTGNDGATTISDYEVGIAIYNGSDLTLTNSTIINMTTGGTDNEAIYLSSNVAPGNIEIYQNIIEDNQYGLWIGDGNPAENYSSTQIYNNIIRDNSFGLRYEPGVASTLNVENNSWGTNNGPRSEAQVGGTQENTYNEVAQGNAVVDAIANSTIDYIPWRRIVTGDDLATKIAGPRFAPIVRTNAANLAQGLYASFNEAEADLVPNQKVYAYAGDYSEHIKMDVSNVQFIGKLAPATYSVGWILAPNSPIFVNAWSNGSQGANANAPRIISGGSALPLVDDHIANFNKVSFKGFIFNTQATATPYVGNPTEAIAFNLNTDDINISNNTFLADAADKAIVFGNGQHDNWDLTYNKYESDGTVAGSGYFAYLVAQTQTTNTTIEYNLLNGGAIFVDKQGAATITDMDINKNQFSNTSGAITLDGTAGGATEVITNLNVQNNRFAASNTYAFLVDAAADNASVKASNWSKEVEVINNEILIAPSVQIAVGFANATPLITYSNEITATCNWWGTPFGATFALNPGGNGARVSEGVFFAPWLSGNGSSTTFEFTPSDACSVGSRVWVNTTGVSTTKTIVFPSLQWAVQHATVVNGTNDHIFVANTYNQLANDAGTNYVQENISVNWNAAVNNTLYTETAANELKINGNFQLAGTNLYNLNLGSDLRVMDNLILDNAGCQGQFILDTKNLTVEDNITDAAYGAVVTNGTGYLIKENVTTGGINRFPVAYTETFTYTPAEFTANASGYSDGILKVRVKNYTKYPTLGSSIVDYKGIGEINHSVQNIWTIDFSKGTAVVDPKIAMTLRFANNDINDPGFTANKTISYAAYWDMAPAATQWTTKKSTSSWNGSDGVQVTNLNLETGLTDWALFYGSTSYALSTPPTQAKNIQWIGGSDRNLEFQWQRNGLNNQYYAIMGVEGSTTAAPSPAFNLPQSTCTGNTLGPWTCSATDRNFSDGYVDNVTPAGSAFWTASLFHDGVALPANVRVLKVGKYTGSSLTSTVIVDSLDQGTYYTFFVANFNNGDGNSAISSMVTGTDGMANYNLDNNTLNPRTRKTQPAVYMTLDLSSAFASDATNQPNLVYGTILPNLTDSTDIMLATNHWRINGALQNKAVVRNQYNWDSLTGGNYAQVCQPSTFPANNVLLYFKGYGNNGGSNWGIKYSENNSTYTFTTPNVNSNTPRTRTEKTTYYLVSAYDGDGKVAALYDNNQNIKLIFDTTTVVDATISGTHPTCEDNAVTFLSQPSSYPNAIFVGWQVYNTTNTAWETVSASNVSSTFNVTGDDLFFTVLKYSDNGKKFRAEYSSTSVCDYPTLGASKYSDTLTLLIYSKTLTGSTPANVEACNTPSSTAVFVSNEGTLVAPNDLTLVRWEYTTDITALAPTWNPLVIAGDYALSTAGTPSVSTLTVSNLSGKDIYGFRAVWSNGDCATPVATSGASLRVVPQPVISGITTPATICANDGLTITASATNWTSVKWYIVGNATDLETLAPAYLVGVTNAVGVDSELELKDLPVSMDGNQFYAVFTNSISGVTQTCTATTANSTIDVLPAPVLDAIADQTVCEATQLQVTTSGTSLSGDVKFYLGTRVPANELLDSDPNIVLSGSPVRTLTVLSTPLSWNGATIIAYNTNGTCDDEETFVVNVDATPTVGTATVTTGEVCAGGNVVYTTTYTPAATGTVVWYYNGTPVVGGGASVAGGLPLNTATIVTGSGTSTLTLTNVSIAIDGVSVYAEVDNGTCTVVNSNSVSADIETIPLAPATVGAQNIFSHRFDVTWTGVANADKYDVEVSDDAGFLNVVASAYNVAAPAVTWTGMLSCDLDPAKTYYFRVSAENQCGNSPWLTSNLVTLDPTVTSIAYQAPDNGAFGNVLNGSNSTAQQIDITYYQLDAGLTIDVPAHYEIYANGSWQTGANVDLTNNLTLYLGTPTSKITTTFDVRFSPTSCGLKTGDLTLDTKEACAGFTAMPSSDFVSVRGTGVVAAPTVASTNGVVMENTANTFSANWTNGNGGNRLVILSTSATLSEVPSNNTTYVPTDVIGNGTVVAVLTNPANTSTFTVPGAGNYYVHVWEYNACGTNTEIYAANGYSFQPYYLKFGTTIPNQVSGTESGNVTLNFTQRNGTLINNPFATFSVTIKSVPDVTIPSTFTTNASPVQIANAANNTTFKFTWTDACGVDGGYLTATATNINGTQSNAFDLNISVPTQQARIMVPVGVPCASSSTFKWTNGNGAGRLFVVRESLLPAAPDSFQVYTYNTDWSARGTSNNIGDNTYVMGVLFNGDSPNNQITITNLSLDSTYYFRAYEFNGCDIDLRKYNLNNATFNPRSRTITCKEGNNLHDIVLDKFNAVSNSGKGILNFNTLYEANISGFELRRMNTTDEEMGGILVGSYMNNSELVAEGNTLTGKSYNFTDNSSLLEVGKSYLYQLTAIAFDGTRIDVAETELTINDDIYTGISEFSVSPVTVTKNEARFDLTVNKAQNVTITMYDVAGQKVATIANDTRVTRGTQQFTTNIQNVTNGTYMIVVEADGVSAVQKFQIVR